MGLTSRRASYVVLCTMGTSWSRASLDFHSADLANAYNGYSNKSISLIVLVAWASKAAGAESATSGVPFIGSGGYSISRTDRLGGWVLTSEPNLENKGGPAR